MSRLLAWFLDDGWGIGLLLVGLLGMIAYGAWYSHKEQVKWDAYAAVHCKVIGKMDGEYANSLDGRGNVGVVYVPGKTGYQCDDGLTYWK